jgi:cytochrome P450
MRFLRGLRDKYRCDHLWIWFPFGRTLLVFSPESMEAVLTSDANAADPFVKRYALSRFIPGALVISSGEDWRHRRQFNEQALDTGTLHRHHDAFFAIAVQEAQRLTERSAELRWSDFQSLGLRISHRIILGGDQVDPKMASQLVRMVRWSNLALRHAPAFYAFYAAMNRYLHRPSPVPPACLMERSSDLSEGGEREATRVPSQIGFWFFVLKDALELHTVRTLALIAAHPEIQTRVRAEIRTAGPLNAQAVAGLTYLEACVLEQLRLWTPVPILLRRALRSFSLRDEIAIAAGRKILIHAGLYHRDPAIFGERADRFSPDAARGDSPAGYFFSAHRQSCAGRSLVTFVLKTTLAALLSRFRFELDSPKIEPGCIPYLYDHFGIELRTYQDA